MNQTLTKVHDKNLHINKKLKGNYLPPDVPENDAWATMNKMLEDDNKAPLPPPNSSNGINKFWSYGLAALIIVCILFWFDENNPQQILTAKHIQNTDDKYKKDLHQFSVNDSLATFNKKDKTASSVDSNDKSDTVENNVKTNVKEENPNRVTSISSTDVRKKNKNSSKVSIGDNADRNNNADINSNNLKKNKTLFFTNKKNATSSSNEIKNKNQTKNFQQKNGRQEDFDNNQTFNNKKNKEEYVKSHNKNKRHNTPTNDKANKNNKENVSDDNTTDETKNVVGKNRNTIKDARENDIAEMKPVKQGSYQSVFFLPIVINDFTKVNMPFKNSSAKAQKNKSEKKFIDFNFGLQWNIPLPIQGTSDYFTGTDDKSKPYNLLIPEIWISKTFGRNNNHKIQLQANLNQQYFAGKKQIATSSGPLSQIDSTTIVTRNTKLLKISGVGFTLQYNYNFSRRWSAGIGLNYHLNEKALLDNQIIRQFDNKLLLDSTYSVNKSSADWRYINKSSLAGKLEISYSIKNIQLGGALFIPINNISAMPNNNVRPLNGQLFLRWKIK